MNTYLIQILLSAGMLICSLVLIYTTSKQWEIAKQNVRFQIEKLNKDIAKSKELGRSTEELEKMLRKLKQVIGE